MPHPQKKEEIEQQIAEIEQEMSSPDFWRDKARAQEKVKELNELKNAAAGVGAYDAGNAVISIVAGAGGTDAEDFARILFSLYEKYAERQGWRIHVVHRSENEHGGLKHITAEVSGKPAPGGAHGPYGTLKHESGVHRLVRISPFNAKQQRHTSFALVEVVPKFTDPGEVEIADSELEVAFARSSGPGGQNVNKRETAVRLKHIPTGLTAHADAERSQAANRERALAVLRGKIYRHRQEQQQKAAEGAAQTGDAEIEWGNQIRSYVFHPYQMIKDHRTNVAVRNVEKVLSDGDIQVFIDAERDLE